MLRFFILLFLFISFENFIAEAKVLHKEDWVSIQDEAKRKVGVMLGTFDPLTLNLEAIISDLLESHKFDELILIPADFTPSKLTRTQLPIRHMMLIDKYQDSENILVPRVYDFVFPQSRSVAQFLEQNKGQRVIVPILQEEDLEGLTRRIILSLLLPTSQSAYIIEKGVVQVKSSRVRKLVSSDSPEVEEFLSRNVIESIKNYDLYKSTPFYKGIFSPFRCFVDFWFSYANKFNLIHREKLDQLSRKI